MIDKKEYSNLSAKEKIEVLRAKLIIKYKFVGVFILSYELHEAESVKTFAFINNNDGKSLLFNSKWINENDGDTIFYSLLCESMEYIFSYTFLYNNLYNRSNQEDLNKLFISLIIVFNFMDSIKSMKQFKQDKFLEICRKYFPVENFNLSLDCNLYIHKLIDFDIHNLPKFAEINFIYNKIYYNWKPWPSRLNNTVENMLKLQKLFNINNFSYNRYIEFNNCNSYSNYICNLDNFIYFIKNQNKLSLEQRENQLCEFIDIKLPIDMTIYVLSFLFLSIDLYKKNTKLE